VVFCTTIEAQIVFETLLAYVASQLAIAGQLRREVYLRSINCFLRARDGNGLEKEFLVDEATGNRFTLLWKTITEPEMGAFPCFWE